MYLLDGELPAASQILPTGPKPWRPPDEAYRARGLEPPSDSELRRAAELRVIYDRKLKQKSPDWIRAWANFEPR